MKRLLVGLGLLAACQTTPQPPKEILISETTKVLDANAQTALKSLDTDGTLRFAKGATPLDFKPGDIVVSGPTAAAPYGFLRKVVASVAPKAAADPDDGGQVFQTKPARLVEAIKRGKIVLKRTLTAKDLPASTPKRLEFTPQGVSVDGLRVNMDTDLGTNGAVQVKGFVDIEPILDLDIGISCNEKVLGICAEIPDLNMTARLGLKESSNLQIKGNLETSFDKEIALYTYTFSPITITVGIPLVFVPKVTIYLGTQGKLSANLSYSTSQSLNVVNGFSYNSDTGFKTISERASTYTKDGPTFSGDTDLKAFAGGRIQVLLYDAVGPYGEIEAGPHLEAHVAGLGANKLLWRFEGCMWLNVGVKIDIFTFEENFETNLFEACTTFAEQNNRPPSINIVRPLASSTIYKGVSTALAAEVFDVDDQAVTCQWRSNNAQDPVPAAGCNSNITFATTGNRTLTLTATDSTGTNATQTVLINAQTPPNILVQITSPLEGGFANAFVAMPLSATTTGGSTPYSHAWSVLYPVTSTGGTIGNPAQVGSTQVYPIATSASASWVPDSTLKLEDLPGCEFDVYAKLILRVTDANGVAGTGSVLLRFTRIC